LNKVEINLNATSLFPKIRQSQLEYNVISSIHPLYAKVGMAQQCNF